MYTEWKLFMSQDGIDAYKRSIVDQDGKIRGISFGSCLTGEDINEKWGSDETLVL